MLGQGDSSHHDSMREVETCEKVGLKKSGGKISLWMRLQHPVKVGRLL